MVNTQTMTRAGGTTYQRRVPHRRPNGHAKPAAKVKEPKPVRQPVPKEHFGYNAALARPQPQMLVEGLIPDKLLTLLYGMTGAGKSYIVAEIAFCLATGKLLFDKLPVTRNATDEDGVVILFSAEEPEAFMQSRMAALVADNFEADVEGRIECIPCAPRLDSQEDLDDCLATVRKIAGKRPVIAIFIETLVRMLGKLHGNDNAAGGAFTSYIERLIAEFDCAVIVSGHSPKSGDRTIAGSQVFTNDAPVTPHVAGKSRTRPDGSRALETITISFGPDDKFRIGPKPAPITVRSKVVTIPVPVFGHETDLVFTAADQQPEIEEDVTAQALDAGRAIGKPLVTVAEIVRHLIPDDADGKRRHALQVQLIRACNDGRLPAKKGKGKRDPWVIETLPGG
jgi:AAA domain